MNLIFGSSVPTKQASGDIFDVFIPPFHPYIRFGVKIKIHHYTECIRCIEGRCPAMPCRVKPHGLQIRQLYGKFASVLVACKTLYTTSSLIMKYYEYVTINSRCHIWVPCESKGRHVMLLGVREFGDGSCPTCREDNLHFVWWCSVHLHMSRF